MQKRLANVYFMAKKRKMEAESAGENIETPNWSSEENHFIIFYFKIVKTRCKIRHHGVKR